MMTTTLGTDCGCGGTSTPCPPGPTAAGERTRYYPRQLVAAADLTQDQIYFREKARSHNRLLHGWGIVCGAEVRVSKQAGCVDVNTGYILGPFGDEILIDEVVTVDLATRNADGDAVSGCTPPDPWCAQVKVPPSADQPVYLAIAYAECPCRPVQTATSGCGCGCEETVCEYSRLRDSYRIRVLDALPETYPAVMTAPPVTIATSCPSDWYSANGYPRRTLRRDHLPDAIPACDCPQCTSCPTSPWVILADITVIGDQIDIDCSSHRRYVASFRDFFYMCPPVPPPPVVEHFIPANASTVKPEWEQDPSITVGFDQDITPACLADPAPWLRMFLVGQTAIGDRIAGPVPLGPGQPSQGRQATFRPTTRGRRALARAENRFTIVVMMRGHAPEITASASGLALDAEFHGTAFTDAQLDALWKRTDFFVPDDELLAALRDGGGRMPSGEGAPGGEYFHAFFDIEIPQ